MEDTHLTRVLRWALVFSTIVAVVLPLYWLLEPNRQAEESTGFDKRAVERGATLFANAVDAGVRQRQVAAVRATATAPTPAAAPRRSSSRPTPRATPNAAPVNEKWIAPSLNDVMYRFNECTDRRAHREDAQLRDPRREPGDPDHHLRPARHADARVGRRRWWAEERAGRERPRRVPEEHPDLARRRPRPRRPRRSRRSRRRWPDRRPTAQKQPRRRADRPRRRRRPTRSARSTRARSQAAQEGITRSHDYYAQVQKMSQGELLFNTQCARCHTKGWSTLEPSDGFVPMPSQPGLGRVRTGAARRLGARPVPR